MSLSRYYEILELKPGATQEEIKAQYKKKALKWHPDKHGGNPEATEKFKLIGEAYQALMNKKDSANFDPFELFQNHFREFDSLFGNPFDDPFFTQPFEVSRTSIFNSSGFSSSFDQGGGTNSFSSSTRTTIINGVKETTKTTVANGKKTVEIEKIGRDGKITKKKIIEPFSNSRIRIE
jgi:curved DNA-binding protein CbpA